MPTLYPGYGTEETRVELEEWKRGRWSCTLFEGGQPSVAIWAPDSAEAWRIMWHVNHVRLSFPFQLVKKELHEHPNTVIINSLSDIPKQLSKKHQQRS